MRLFEQWWLRHKSVFLPAGLFWLILVAVSSAQPAPAGQELTWQQVLRRAAISSTVWALLLPLIIELDRRLPVGRDALLKRLFFHVPLSLLFPALKQLLVAGVVTVFLKSGPELTIDSLQASFKGTFQAGVFAYWVVIFLYIAFDYNKCLKEQEIGNAELRKLASESRLEILRAQLHPHFLFNALNTISAHAERSPSTARRMLDELEELLRLALAHSEDREVRLAQEIAFVEHYLAIQKVRFQDRLGATVKVDSDVLDALVPTFILQPLVENAVLYGLSPRMTKGTVEVCAWRTNGQLHLAVQDNGPGLPQDWDPEESVGIGISNSRERLRQLYGESNQSFDIRSEAGRGVCVEITMPFHRG